jgi:ribosomal protein L1
MASRGKKYRLAAEKVDRNKQYSLDEAVALLKDASHSQV